MRKFFILMLVFFNHLAFAQNLVPNPDFEAYNTCPNTLSCINYSPTYSMFTWVKGWINPTMGPSTDYFNTCATSTCSVPSNTFGYQVPHSGNAYVGGYAYLGKTPTNKDTFYSENIECKLNSPLIAGKAYAVSFYVSMIMFPNNNGYNYIGLDRLGVHFSDTLIYEPNSSVQHLTLSYDVVNTTGNFLTDTMNWMKVSGTYIAKGGEQYMVMGSFADGNPITSQQVNPTTAVSTNQSLCYYFYDDVSVMETCDTSYVKHDSTACGFDPIAMKLVSSVGSGTKLWNTGEKTPSVVAKKAGQYWCVTSDGCLVKIDTFRIRNFRNLFVNSADKYLCKDSVVDPLYLASLDTADTYHWNNNTTDSAINVTNTGKFWCEAVLDCDLYVDTFNVKRFKEYIYRNHDSVVCLYKTPFYVDLSSEPASEVYMWSTLSHEPSISVTDTGRYWSRSVKDCNVYNDTFTLVHKAFDDKVNLGDDRVICKDEPYDASLGTRFDAVPYYIWNTGDTSCCITMRETGQYKLTITDGCTYNSDSVKVQFVEDCNDCLFVPTAFTPNNDGKNDGYRCIPRCALRSYNIKIFSRYGEVLFNTENIDYRWNGAYKSQDMPIGTYFYLITYITEGNNKTYLKKGDITLIR